MKRTTTLGLAVVLTAMLISCGQGVKSGAAAGEALIRLMPKGTMGVLAVDVQRALGTEAAAKMLQEPQAKAKYDEFVQMSGIDPIKDISYIGVGLSADGGKIGDGGVVISMNYDQAKLRALMKEKAPEVVEEDYNGVPYFSNLDGTEPDGQKTKAAFLDAGHIVVGSEKMVKGIIDVQQKKGDSIAKDPTLAGALKKVDKSAIAWGAFAVPQDLLRKGIESAPQMKALEGVTALTLSFDYRLATFVADIRTHGGTKEQNETLASTLNGFKSLGAMFAAQEPLAGEALDGVEISSGADYTRISINLPQETLDKLAKLAQSKAGDLMKSGKGEDTEEKK